MNDPLPTLPRRPVDAHKGTFGTVAVVGGCASAASRMIGAPSLSALAALRSGAGLARIAAPSPIIDASISLAPGATGVALPVNADNDIVPHESAAVLDTIIASCDCLAIGPGLGRSDGARAISLRAVQQEDVPAVVDADAINNLAEIPQLTRDLRGRVILTPHPGEFRRLCQGLGLNSDLGLAQSRENAATQLAQRLGCIVVLKGAGTVVSDGHRAWINTTGHPCLATAGTGDVLTGLLASLIAQFVAPPPPPGIPESLRSRFPKPPEKPLDLFDAARLAVHAHGLAAERWASRNAATGGMLATDLANELPSIIESLRS